MVSFFVSRDSSCVFCHFQEVSGLICTFSLIPMINYANITVFFTIVISLLQALQYAVRNDIARCVHSADFVVFITQFSVPIF